MKCHEARRRLDLFMDGELSVPENLKVLEHLNLCRPCGTFYEGEKALRGALKEEWGGVRAPSALVEKLSRSLSEKAIAVPRRRGWGTLAAAAFFLTLIGTLLFTPTAELPQALAATVAEQHARTCRGYCGVKSDDCICVCEGCSEGGEAPLRAFFGNHGRKDACLHDLKELGYEFVGASVWTHRGHTVCWTVQRNDQGHAVTHALVSTPIAMEARPLPRRTEDGKVVVFVPRGDGGKTCVFIFDHPAAADRFLALMKMK